MECKFHIKKFTLRLPNTKINRHILSLWSSLQNFVSVDFAVCDLVHNVEAVRLANE